MPISSGCRRSQYVELIGGSSTMNEMETRVSIVVPHLDGNIRWVF
jgi:hypothetical protein